jgi:hypothetical protein
MLEVFEPPTGGRKAAAPAAKRKTACGLKREDGAYHFHQRPYRSCKKASNVSLFM